MLVGGVESKKAKVKEKIVILIDEYYEKFESGSNTEEFDINKIEGLMLENRKELEKIMIEANNELCSDIHADVKKNVLSADLDSKEPKRGKKQK
jgi:hypothetical protein